MSQSSKMSLALTLGLLLVFAVLAGMSDAPLARRELSAPQWGGTLVMFALLPGYLLAMFGVMRRRTELMLETLELSSPAAARDEVRSRLFRFRAFVYISAVVGLIYGFYQNSLFVEQIGQRMAFEAIDVAFILGGGIVWTLIVMLLSWRLSVSAAVSRLGAALELDLYRLDKLRPLARLATVDVLIVAGAMAFMPLQSLDAEFRLANYVPGFVIGVCAGIGLFLLPLWGVHQNIKRLRATRIEALCKEIDGIDRSQLAVLEPAMAHLERVSSIVSWPIDLQLVARIFASFVIPPLAWVAAALVENMVDRF